MGLKWLILAPNVARISGSIHASSPIFTRPRSDSWHQIWHVHWCVDPSGAPAWLLPLAWEGWREPAALYDWTAEHAFPETSGCPQMSQKFERSKVYPCYCTAMPLSDSSVVLNGGHSQRENWGAHQRAESGGMHWRGVMTPCSLISKNNV